MVDEARSFAVRQVFYAGLGWGGSALFIALTFWSIVGFDSIDWTTYVFLAGALQGAALAIWNADLHYDVDTHGLARTTRWRKRELARWSEVTGIHSTRWNNALHLALANGRHVKIPLSELRDPEAFRRLVEERLGR